MTLRILPSTPLLLMLVAACAMPRDVVDTRERTRETLQRAVKLYGQLCSPEELANAQSHLDFANIELYQGSVRRADQHIEIAYENALKALEISRPCGGADRDRDTIPDIVDACPDEPEDFDGDRDTDGCRDIDPYGDEDKDGGDEKKED